MKAILITALSTLISQNIFALGVGPDEFRFGPQVQLTCVPGPGIFKLSFDKRVGSAGIYKDTYEVSGHGLTNTYGVQAKEFEAFLEVKSVPTRAYYGQEVSGLIPDLNGKISLKNHTWYSYPSEGIPIHFTGTFESFKSKQLYSLICFPNN